MRIWTFTDVQPDEELIRTSIHGTEEDAMNALRSYVAANNEDYQQEELESYTFSELEQLIPPDALVSIDQHWTRELSEHADDEAYDERGLRRPDAPLGEQS